MKLNVLDRLYALLKRKDLSKKLSEHDHNFKDVVKYLLPKLLEGPIYHLKYCFDVFDVSLSSPVACLLTLHSFAESA